MTDAKKEKCASAKERIRAYYRTHQLCAAIDSTEIEKEMALRYDIALRMMMDQMPDEKIRHYCLLSQMQIEYIRTSLLPKYVKELECKSRTMNESLRR